MNRSGIRALAKARQKVTDPAQAVLATVIETQGSSYRKAGARMLIDLNPDARRLTGIVGGGCFDDDLIEHARSVVACGQCQTQLYDMRSDDDILWGLGMGCNGAVQVLLQPLSDHTPDPVALLEQLEQAGGGLLATRLADGHTWIGAEGEFAVDQPTLLESAGQDLFVHPVPGCFQLGIFGTGSDVLPVLELADQLDWRVCLWDHRVGQVQPQRFPAAQSVKHFAGPTPPDAAACDALLIMSHSYDADLKFLRAVVELEAPYVGVLGPSSRRDKLVEDLGELGQALGPRLHGPVGMDLGGDTPEAIALSVCAELQALRHRRSGSALSGA
ncbi:MAG: XdhC family protein [Pseudomonadota bacterium]